MAKYTINYACGHGSYEEQLVGPTKDRERRIAWLESNKVCKDCWIRQEKERDTRAERVAYVHGDGVNLQIIVRISGGIEENEAALRDLGFEWSRDYGGVEGLLSVREPRLALCRFHPFTSVAEMEAWVSGVGAEIAPLGYKIIVQVSDIEISMFRESLQRKAQQDAERAEKIAANPAPTRPAWYQAAFDAAKAATGGPVKTNGQIYGGKGRQRIYISGQEVALTDDQADELRAYQAARSAHIAASK